MSVCAGWRLHKRNLWPLGWLGVRGRSPMVGKTLNGSCEVSWIRCVEAASEELIREEDGRGSRSGQV